MAAIGATFSGGWQARVQRHFAGWALRWKHLSDRDWYFAGYFTTKEAAMQAADRSDMSKPLTHITRTHIVFLADGKTEALTIYERTPAFERDGNQRTHTINFPSRRMEEADPGLCLEYAKAWREAADWIKRRQGIPDKGPPWCCQCGSPTDLCGCGKRKKNIIRGENA